MILVADGGSTKTSWCLIEKDVNRFFETEGYHPFFVDENYIQLSLDKNVPENIKQRAKLVEEIWFYSAGGGYSVKTDQILAEGFSKLFTYAKTVIETDILAAARALLQKEKGLAAILGTGSNTCLYDGEKITMNIESLGFLLGDEGSGAYLGKKILSDYIRGYMPAEISKIFNNKYHLTPEKALNKLYADALPNRYCAKFAVFVKENIENDYCKKMAYECFDIFFKNIVSRYPDYKNYTFNSVGSIAYYFKEIISEVVGKYSMQTGEMIVSAIEGLVKFHTQTK